MQLWFVNLTLTSQLYGLQLIYASASKRYPPSCKHSWIIRAVSIISRSSGSITSCEPLTHFYTSHNHGTYPYPFSVRPDRHTCLKAEPEKRYDTAIVRPELQINRPLRLELYKELPLKSLTGLSGQRLSAEQHHQHIGDPTRQIHLRGADERLSLSLNSTDGCNTTR